MDLRLEVLKSRKESNWSGEQLPDQLKDLWDKVKLQKITEMYQRNLEKRGKIDFLESLAKKMFFIVAGFGVASEICNMSINVNHINLYTVVPKSCSMYFVCSAITFLVRKAVEESNVSRTRSLCLQTIWEKEQRQGEKEIVFYTILERNNNSLYPGEHRFYIVFTIKTEADEDIEDLLRDPILYAKKCVEYLLEIEKYVGIPDETGKYMICFNLGKEHESMEKMQLETEKIEEISHHQAPVFNNFVQATKKGEDFFAGYRFPVLYKLARKNKKNEMSFLEVCRAFSHLLEITIKYRYNQIFEIPDKTGIKATTENLLRLIFEKRKDLGKNLLEKMRTNVWGARAKRS